MTDLTAFLAGASVDAAVFELRPDYRVRLIALDGLEPRHEGLHATADDLMQVRSARRLIAAGGDR